MKDHAAKGHDFILRALKTSTELEVDEKGEHVRRVRELQKPKDQFERSVYAVRLFTSDPILRERISAHGFDMIERVWEGGTGSAAKIGGVFRNLWQGECCEDASGRREKRVQGFPVYVIYHPTSLILFHRVLYSWSLRIWLVWKLS